MKTSLQNYSHSTERHVGIGVGKSTLDVFLLEKNQYWQVENSAADIKRLLARLARLLN